MITYIDALFQEWSFSDDINDTSCVLEDPAPAMWVGTSHEFLEYIRPWLSLAALFLQKLKNAYIAKLSCCMIINTYLQSL